MNEAAVERIASLPGFLVGSTFHGIVPQVKHQMMSRVPRAPGAITSRTDSRPRFNAGALSHQIRLQSSAGFQTKFGPCPDDGLDGILDLFRFSKHGFPVFKAATAESVVLPAAAR
jgi:hypothetical protein